MSHSLWKHNFTSDVSQLQNRLHHLEKSVESHQQNESQIQKKLDEALQQVEQLSPAAAQSKTLQTLVEQLTNNITGSSSIC